MPRINKNPVLLLPQCPTNSYALGVMKHPNPIGEGFATQARLEAAGPECIIPGQITPLRILGVKWALGFISWTTVYIFFDTESQSSSRVCNIILLCCYFVLDELVCTLKF
ncbi:hypothetical protein HPP92_010165 [Vanilla planifolia]|uniref:Uncharacterized protein n=1 Tax=Vanilla planifolia TaxID=51239 RepID=A0A835R4L8_VANPL|nr:hypothetical protein HPP92_010165 [Vanilla planifolia]